MRSLAAMALAIFAFVSYAGTPTSTVQSTPGVLAGIVKNRSGAPVQGVKVELVRDGSVVHSTLSDASGQFRFTGVAAGSYVLRASVKGFETLIRHQVVGESGADQVELILAGGPIDEELRSRSDAEQKSIAPSARAAEVAEMVNVTKNSATLTEPRIVAYMRPG